MLCLDLFYIYLLYRLSICRKIDPLLETYLLNFNYKFFNSFHSDSFKFLKTLDSKEPFTLAKKYYNFSLFFTTYSKNEISYTMSDVSTNNAIFTDSLNIEKSTTWFDDYLTYDSDAANSHPFWLENASKTENKH